MNAAPPLFVFPRCRVSPHQRAPFAADARCGSRPSNRPAGVRARQPGSRDRWAVTARKAQRRRIAIPSSRRSTSSPCSCSSSSVSVTRRSILERSSTATSSSSRWRSSPWRSRSPSSVRSIALGCQACGAKRGDAGSAEHVEGGTVAGVEQLLGGEPPRERVAVLLEPGVQGAGSADRARGSAPGRRWRTDGGWPPARAARPPPCEPAGVRRVDALTMPTVRARAAARPPARGFAASCPCRSRSSCRRTVSRALSSSSEPAVVRASRASEASCSSSAPASSVLTRSIAWRSAPS
jgi:hypothetical protein